MLVFSPALSFPVSLPAIAVFSPYIFLRVYLRRFTPLWPPFSPIITDVTIERAYEYLKAAGSTSITMPNNSAASTMINNMQLV